MYPTVAYCGISWNNERVIYLIFATATSNKNKLSVNKIIVQLDILTMSAIKYTCEGHSSNGRGDQDFEFVPL